MKPTHVHGYADRLSVAPGETIEFKVSCEVGGYYRADLVRLVSGDTHPEGPGFKLVAIRSVVNGEYPARLQLTDPGSFITVSDPGAILAPTGPFTLHAFIQATAPERGEQAILGRYAVATGRGYALVLHEGRLALRVGAASGPALFTGAAMLAAGVWYSVAAVVDSATGTVTLYQRAVVNAVNGSLGRSAVDRAVHVSAHATRHGPADSHTPFIIAGLARAAGLDTVDTHFSGKIDSPKIWGRALPRAELDTLADTAPSGDALLAHWDFAAGIGAHGIPGDHVIDRGPNQLHGTCVNMPVRAVTGWNWTGAEENFRHAPREYGAIHFHDDDLDDCRWQTDVALTVPEDFPSDVYALHLQLGDAEDWIPFFVLPPRGTATAKVLFLAPTASYLAYANYRVVHDGALTEAFMGGVKPLTEQDLYLHAHVELGLSTYDVHGDGSGVCYASARRPLLNMRPKFGAGLIWQFPADLHLIDWLNACGIDYDVATDLELHQQGADLLDRYRVVLTGTHPEYCSTPMLDAWERYLDRGGRCMYLGANGFYWVTAWHPHKPWLIEVRKGEGGTRAWQARPGEYYLAATGERSGVWRNRNRAPQKMFGVGFTAQGFDHASGYEQLPDARDPRVAFIMAGIPPDAKIGDFGLVGGGAAGYELDRYDLALGTPAHALLLASSEGQHSDNYPRVADEIYTTYPGLGGTQDFQVRADIVYFTTPNGGAVFTPGSISWCGSLAHNQYDNNVSRMTGNVLRRFMADEPLPPL